MSKPECGVPKDIWDRMFNELPKDDSKLNIPRYDGWECIMHVEYVQAIHYDEMVARGAETILAAERKVADAMKERDTVAANLAKYGRHLPGCGANQWPVKMCNCGWDAIERGLLR